MKAFALSFGLIVMLPATPILGQQPTDKPQIPPWDDAIFAHGAAGTALSYRISWKRYVPTKAPAL